MSEETNSGDGSCKMANDVMKSSSSFSEKSNSEKRAVNKSQVLREHNVGESNSSSSEYSSDSEEGDDGCSSDSDSETSSSEEDEGKTNEGKVVSTKDSSRTPQTSFSKSSTKDLGGISRAKILENVENNSIDVEDHVNFQSVDQLDRKRINKPSDFSLAFIGCEDAKQFNQKPQSHVMPMPGMSASSKISRKPSSLSQRYGMVRRSTSRGSGSMEATNAANAIEYMEENTGSSAMKNKSLELDDIQLDEYIYNANGTPYSTKPQSPKILRPENKVILGDSTDNVSILTDGMIN